MVEHTILFLTPSVRLLGARRSLLTLVISLIPPFKPYVICSNTGPLFDELNNANVPASVVKHYNWRKGKYVFHRYAQGLKLRKAIYNINPSLIHVNEVHSLPVALWALGKKKIPVVVHHRLMLTKRQIINYHLNKADIIIAVSKAAARDFDGFGLSDKIRIVYNGIDINDFKKSEETIVSGMRVRRELGLEKDDFLCGIVGLIGERKRQHIAISAAKKIVSQNPKCHFLFIGDPPQSMTDYAAALKVDVEVSGISKNIHFLPFRKDIKSVYAAMDLNLLISSEEGFGRTIIEAGAMEMASIGTNIGGIPEIIIPNETGFLIELDDVDSLAERILSCFSDREQLKKMGKNARKIVETKFSIESHRDQIQKIYQELINN